jgi:hypothetical protein
MRCDHINLLAKKTAIFKSDKRALRGICQIRDVHSVMKYPVRLALWGIFAITWKRSPTLLLHKKMMIQKKRPKCGEEVFIPLLLDHQVILQPGLDRRLQESDNTKETAPLKRLRMQHHLKRRDPRPRRLAQQKKRKKKRR